MMKLALSFAFLCLLAFGLQAQKARIDVSSTDKKTGMVFLDASERVGVGQAEWLGDLDKDKRLCAIAKVSEERRSFSFSFTPKATGVVQAILMSDAKDAPVCFASVRAKGAALANGDFSKLDAKGGPEAWILSGGASLERSPEGGAFAKVDHDGRFVQSFRVTKGEPVEIDFVAFSFKTQPAR